MANNVENVRLVPSLALPPNVLHLNMLFILFANAVYEAGRGVAGRGRGRRQNLFISQRHSSYPFQSFKTSFSPLCVDLTPDKD